MVRGFLDDDVGVSEDDDVSSDECGSDLDDSLEGFIASQLSQQVNESGKCWYTVKPFILQGI